MLADKLAVSRPSVTGVVDGLVARGLVPRNPDAADRRRIGVDLTGDGRRLLRASPTRRSSAGCAHRRPRRRRRRLPRPRRVERRARSDWSPSAAPRALQGRPDERALSEPSAAGATELGVAR